MPIETVESILSNEKSPNSAGISSINASTTESIGQNEQLSPDKQALLRVIDTLPDSRRDSRRQEAAINSLPDNVTQFMQEYLNKIKELNLYHGNNN